MILIVLEDSTRCMSRRSHSIGSKKARWNCSTSNNSQGTSVPLSAFVNIENIVGPDYTNRYNLYRSVELTGSPARALPPLRP